MTFPEAFRAHVVPRMRAMIRVQAVKVHAGDHDFGDAADAVMRRALQMGASYLPSDVFADLSDYVLVTLANDIAQAEVVADRLAADEAADPVGYYTRLAGDDAGLQRAFASICPEYRRAIYSPFRPELRAAHGR